MKSLYCTGFVRHFWPLDTPHCLRGMREEGQWGRIDQNWVTTWCSNTHPTARFWLPTFMTCSISFTLLQTKDWRSYKKHNTNYILKWLYIFNSLFLNFEPIYKKCTVYYFFLFPHSSSHFTLDIHYRTLNTVTSLSCFTFVYSKCCHSHLVLIEHLRFKMIH